MTVVGDYRDYILIYPINNFFLNNVVNIFWIIHLIEYVKGGIKHKAKGIIPDKAESKQDKDNRSKYKECY